MNIIDLFLTHPSFMQHYQADRVQRVLQRASLTTMMICFFAAQYDWMIFEIDGYYIHSQVIFTLMACFGFYTIWRSILFSGRIALFQPDYVRTCSLKSISRRNLFFNVVFGIFFIWLSGSFLYDHFSNVNKIAVEKPHLVKVIR